MQVNQLRVVGRSVVDSDSTAELVSTAVGYRQLGALPQERREGLAASLLQSRQQVLEQRQAQLPRLSGGLFAKLSRQLQAKLLQVQEQALQRQAALQGQGRGLLVNLSSLSGSLKDKLQALKDQAALAPVLADVKQKLQAQAANPGAFNVTLQLAFGDRFDAAKAEALRQQVLAGNFSWMPKIQIVSQKELTDLTGAQGSGVGLGAYAASSDTIYLSRELLADPAQASSTLLEEIAHGLDVRLNGNVDSTGDEGEIFSRLVHGEVLDAQTLQALRADNDRGLVRINGKLEAVEYGWLKKAAKKIGGSVKKAVKKVTKAVVNGVVNTFKAAVKVAVGLATFDFDKVKQGFSDGVNAVKDTVKEVYDATRESIKEIHEAAKELVKKALTSQFLGYVLMVARCIPIPVVVLVVRIVEIARAAYMLYQGVKNKSLAAIVGGVASLAGAGAKYAGNFGASAGTVKVIGEVAKRANQLNLAYKTVADKDLSAGFSLLAGTKLAQGALSGNATLAKVASYAQRGAEIRTALRKGDKLDALGGALGVAGMAIGGQTEQTLKNARYGVDVARAVRLVEQGNIAMADKIIAALPLAQQASKTADKIVEDRRTALLAAQQQQAPQQASAPVKVQTQGIDPQAPVTVSQLVQPGQTLEGIARQAYPEDWRAGLALLVDKNNIQFDLRTGTPLLRPGQALETPDLDSVPQQERDNLAQRGGQFVSRNAIGLQPKEEPPAAKRLSVTPMPAESAEPMGRTTQPLGPLSPASLRNDSAAPSGSFLDFFFGAAQAAEVPAALNADKASGQAQRSEVIVSEGPDLTPVASTPNKQPFGGGEDDGRGVAVRASTEEGEVLKRFQENMRRDSTVIARVPEGLTKLDGSPVTLSYDAATGDAYWNLGEGEGEGSALRAIPDDYATKITLKQAALADPNNPLAKYGDPGKVLLDFGVLTVGGAVGLATGGLTFGSMMAAGKGWLQSGLTAGAVGDLTARTSDTAVWLATDGQYGGSATREPFEEAISTSWKAFEDRYNESIANFKQNDPNALQRLGLWTADTAAKTAFGTGNALGSLYQFDKDMAQTVMNGAVIYQVAKPFIDTWVGGIDSAQYRLSCEITFANNVTTGVVVGTNLAGVYTAQKIPAKAVDILLGDDFKDALANRKFEASVPGGTTMGHFWGYRYGEGFTNEFSIRTDPFAFKFPIKGPYGVPLQFAVKGRFTENLTRVDDPRPGLDLEFAIPSNLSGSGMGTACTIELRTVGATPLPEKGPVKRTIDDVLKKIESLGAQLMPDRPAPKQPEELLDPLTAEPTGFLLPPGYNPNDLIANQPIGNKQPTPDRTASKHPEELLDPLTAEPTGFLFPDGFLPRGLITNQPIESAQRQPADARK